MSCLAIKRAVALKVLATLFADRKRVLLIHYACDDFANRPDGSSARITSIAVRHFEGAVTHSFSANLIAELLHIDHGDVKPKYDEIEAELLRQFASFMTKYQSYTWVHWCMRDTNYGFPHIYHRCRMHNIDLNEIAPDNLVDLSRCLVDVYGSEYIDHPRLPKLIERNKITDIGFLDGLAEVKAFANGDFVSIHRSTLRKVDAFESIITRAHAGTLSTSYRWRDIYGKSPKDVVMYVKEHWLYALSGLIALALGLIAKFSSLFAGSPSLP